MVNAVVSLQVNQSTNCLNCYNAESVLSERKSSVLLVSFKVYCSNLDVIELLFICRAETAVFLKSIEQQTPGIGGGKAFLLKWIFFFFFLSSVHVHQVCVCIYRYIYEEMFLYILFLKH